MVHLHTPTRPSIRHLQESSVLKEADYLEEEEEEGLALKTEYNSSVVVNFIWSSLKVLYHDNYL